MSSNSSILNSDAALAGDRPAYRFCRRLAQFLALPLLIMLVIAAMVARTGELTPVSVIAWLQTLGRPFIYLTEYSDHTYRLKIDAVRLFKPEVLVMGASRCAEWRSAMFKPHSFYNAGNSAQTLNDYSNMLRAFAPYAPRVIIFSIDFYAFNNAWDPTFNFVSRGDIAGLNSPETALVAKKLIEEARAEPLKLMPTLREPYFRDPLYGVPALGMMAAKSGTGTRIDGSYQYGARILGHPGLDLESSLQRVVVGRKPLQFGERIDQEQREAFKRFVALAKSKGIALVGISAPYAPELAEALDRSPRHQIWRDFQQPEFADWIRRQGVIYFNFTRLESFGGKPEEFVDPFHPSEPAHIRMLLTMLRDPAFHALFSYLDPKELEARLKSATALEVYRNEF